VRFEFGDCRVIVTGGTRGIGAAIARAFVSAGASVTATYAGRDDAAQAFRQSLEDRSERLTLARFDVSDPSAVKRFFDQLDFTPSVLVNNAGIRRDAVLGMMTEDDWRRVLAVNLDGTWAMSKHAVQLMSRARTGRIINVISPSGRLGLAGQANYAASKAGQEAMAKCLAKEVAKRGITVNCVSPGFVDTDLLADLDADTKQKLLQTVPLRRFAEPGEVASAVLFLASPEASYITGTTLEVSGGL
jgi:3-oxoacyl-[acyl-carrier protein] reductase